MGCFYKKLVKKDCDITSKISLLLTKFQKIPSYIIIRVRLKLSHVSENVPVLLVFVCLQQAEVAYFTYSIRGFNKFEHRGLNKD